MALFNWFRFQLEGMLRHIPYNTGIFIRKIFYRIFFGVSINVRDGAFVTHITKIDMHPTSFIGRCADVNAAGGLKIGENVGFAPHIIIRTVNHEYDNRDALKNRHSFKFAPVEIGDGAWIGAQSVILPGVKIGDFAVVGAGSVVTKDIPAEHVAVGNPCKVIKKIRFKEDIAAEQADMAGAPVPTDS